MTENLKNFHFEAKQFKTQQYTPFPSHMMSFMDEPLILCAFFAEENISEAFKTLEVYQKALETERARVKKTIEEGMSPDTAVSITRKLRKLYAVTQKNMDLLDRAIGRSNLKIYSLDGDHLNFS